MNAEPHGNEGRADPLATTPDCGNAGDFARWESKRDHDEAERAETVAACDAHRVRFIASGGEFDRFEGLHLLAAARNKMRRILNLLCVVRCDDKRAPTEDEIRTTLAGMVDEAIDAQRLGRLRAFRRMLWPFGTPLND